MSSLQGWANTQADGKSGGFGVAYQGDTANRMRIREYHVSSSLMFILEFWS